MTSLAVRLCAAALLVAAVWFEEGSAGLLKRHMTQMEWHDPMDNVTEAGFYAAADAMAALDPPPHWDAAAAGYRPGRATTTHSCNHIRAVPRHLRSSTHMRPSGLDYFYQKYTEAYGIPVLGSRQVTDEAMKRACYVTRFLFADHSRVRQSYYARSGRVAVIAANEGVTTIPEHRWLGPSWNARARGLGATDNAPVSTCGEEHMLCWRSDRYRDEDIMIHELSHGVHLLGAKYAISGWQNRLTYQYNAARRSGRWANTYAMSTADEYFGEGTQSYFNCNAYSATANGIHNSINTQSKLRSYDPALFQLVQQVFPCNNRLLQRCRHTRAEEMQQQLRMDCDVNGGGVTQAPVTTTTTTTRGGGGGGATTAAPSGCRDTNTNCGSWAQYGYCTSYSSYMNRNCRRSCNLCGGGGGNCKDESSHCSYWASNGECTANPSYMLESCKKSCNRC